MIGPNLIADAIVDTLGTQMKNLILFVIGAAFGSLVTNFPGVYEMFMGAVTFFN